MVGRPEQYTWSSCRAAAGYEAASEWLKIGEIATLFGEAENWHENYKAYVVEKLTSEERLFNKVERQIYLGTEEWVASMRKLVESKMRSDDHPSVQRTVGRPTMSKIFDAVAGAFRTSAGSAPAVILMLTVGPRRILAMEAAISAQPGSVPVVVLPLPNETGRSVDALEELLQKSRNLDPI